MRCVNVLTAALFTMAIHAATAHAVDLPIANHSFEAPVVDEDFLPVALEAPPWVLSGPGPYIDLGAGPQNTGTGIFPNPSTGSTGHFDNPDGNQLAYIFTNASGNTQHQFLQHLSATYLPGRQYDLTVSIANAGAAPGPGDQLEIALAYLQAGSPVRIATRAVMNNASDNLSGTHVKDFLANSSILSPADPAIGQDIYVLLTASGAGGTQFVMDNVRASFAGAGDANRDGIVNGDDLGVLAHNWQQSGNWRQGDFTLDGFVDIKDLYLLASNWPNSAPAIAAVGLPSVGAPEPNGFLAILSLGAAMLRRTHARHSHLGLKLR